MNTAIKHLCFHHGSSDGWVTLAQKKSGEFKQCHFRVEELQDKLSEWMGQDVYFSQNTFYRPRRRIENVRQLRALYCDIDCYKSGFTINQVELALEGEYFRQSIPEPNYIIYSGRGLVLVWLIEPVPIMGLPRWQAVENHFAETLKPLGADTKATDAARIFRLAGTRNSKSGKLVTVEYKHDFVYDLEALKNEYLPEIKKEKRATKSHSKKIEHLFNIYTLHYSRLIDLYKLIQLRNYDMTGYRETSLFLYRYWSCCYLTDKEEALRQTLSLNSELKEPLTEREVTRATKSAEKAYEKWMLNTSNGTYKRDGYNFTNEKLISLLDITPEEQRHMKTIIGKEEKQRRNTIAKREKRRNEGVIERRKYIEEQKNITEQRLKVIRKILLNNPKIKNKEIAELLSITPARVSQLRKQIDDR